MTLRIDGVFVSMAQKRSTPSAIPPAPARPAERREQEAEARLLPRDPEDPEIFAWRSALISTHRAELGPVEDEVVVPRAAAERVRLEEVHVLGARVREGVRLGRVTLAVRVLAEEELTTGELHASRCRRPSFSATWRRTRPMPSAAVRSFLLAMRRMKHC